MARYIDPSESWESRIRRASMLPKHPKNVVDDGFFSNYSKEAEFTDGLEFVVLSKPRNTIITESAIPFSQHDRSTDCSECVVFFENDPLFADAILSASCFIEKLRAFPCVATPDCSLYRDMPLNLQFTNIYLNRLIGWKYHCEGLNVYPTVRWSDERTYGPNPYENVPASFSGLPTESIYWIGSYGVCKNRENRYHFEAGLDAMMHWLSPKQVLVYGPMPDKIFSQYERYADFRQYPNWIKAKHDKNGGDYGQRK